MHFYHIFNVKFLNGKFTSDFYSLLNVILSLGGLTNSNVNVLARPSPKEYELGYRK